MRKLHILFFLLVVHVAVSQEVIVPYRVGELMGLADTNGHVVVDAAYHSIGKYKMPKDAFTFTKVLDTATIKSKFGTSPSRYKKKCGILYQHKKILETELADEFDYLPDAFVIGHARDGYLRENTQGIFTDSGLYYHFKTKEDYEYYEKRRDCKFLFNKEGKNIFPDGWRRIIPVDFIGSQPYHYVLFILEDFDGLISLAQLNVTSGKIDRWLLKDKSSLDRPSKKHGGVDAHLVVYNGNRHDDPQFFNILHNPNGFALSEVFSKTNSVESGITDNDVATLSPYSAAKEEAIVVEEPMPARLEPVKAQKPVEYNLNHSFLREGSNYLFFQTAKVNGKPLPDTQFLKVTLPIDTAFVYQNNSYITRRIDTVFKISSSVFFRTTDHQFGMISSVDGRVQEFDSLLMLHTNLAENNSLLLGMRKEEGKKKFGMMNLKNEILLPFVYDSIIIQKDIYQTTQSNRVLNSLSPSTAILLAYKEGNVAIFANYDSLICNRTYDEVEYDGSFGGFLEPAYIFRKEGFYDLLLTKGTYYRYLKLVLPYRPRSIIRNYNEVKGLDLITLEDTDKKFFCYATFGGKVLYRPKK